jgi:flagellar protein FliS
VGSGLALNPYRAYIETEVNSASKGRLVLMLYNGTLRFLSEAKTAITQKDPACAHEKITKAIDIVAELHRSLDDTAGDITDNLDKIYDYVERCLVRANMKKSCQEIDNAIGVLSELRDAWARIAATPIPR